MPVGVPGGESRLRPPQHVRVVSGPLLTSQRVCVMCACVCVRRARARQVAQMPQPFTLGTSGCDTIPLRVLNRYVSHASLDLRHHTARHAHAALCSHRAGSAVCRWLPSR
jgi:hypothetical protein